MPAPATNKLLAFTLLLAACASNLPEPELAATPAIAQESATQDRYTPPPPAPAAPVEALADLETSLAAYEAQLAQNEARLQAMGVRIARAEPATSANLDNRVAPPPPARPGDAPLAGATSSASARPTEEKSERLRAKKTADPRRPTTPRPNGGFGRTQSDPAGKASAPAPARDEADDKDGERGRCADLCDLASSTCDLEVKICDLAARHVDEPRYAEVCQRAGDDCSAAADACTLCSP